MWFLRNSQHDLSCAETNIQILLGGAVLAFAFLSVSTVIHQTSRIREEISSVALMRIESISDFDSPFFKMHLTHDSCSHLDVCNFIRNENTWVLFWGFFLQQM